MSWHKVSGKLQKEDCRREHCEWMHLSNASYRKAVDELADGIKAAFPARVDTAKIGNCSQTRDECVQDFYHRLYLIFSKHSGLEEPDERGDQAGTWECHMRSWFLNGLRPEIAQAVKTSYIEWKSGRLSAVLAHALHAEEMQTAKKERVKAKTNREWQLAFVQAVSKPGGYSAQQNQQSKWGRWKRGGGRYPNETLKDGAVGSARLMNMRYRIVPDADCAKRTAIGRRIARRTGEINRQTEARETESREEGSRASNQQSQVKAAQEKVAEIPLHNLKPGDFVMVRDLRRKSRKAKRWLGPFQVLLTTHTAVKGAERPTWIQATCI
ncbi:uncharacterized protein LOC127953420 [Carassius gibelio]|uniref:uncharacterized protein LOC127953420 n=1 Tax=Carassius gibelio TaxID=101364 RepID=UPI002279C50B|nr:uncharacterized protein LOC127953420 [Carassius gibelio]